jgi:hypothetical protein
MRTPEIFFGSIIRPISFTLPTYFISGRICDCNGLTLGIDTDAYCGWADLRTPDQIEACACWLDGLYAASAGIRTEKHTGERTDVGLFIPDISPEFEGEFDGSSDLTIEAVVSSSDEEFCIWLGRTTGQDGSEFGEWDTLKTRQDMESLAALLRDVATALRTKNFHWGRGNPMRAYFKDKPPAKPLLLTERRAA